MPSAHRSTSPRRVAIIGGGIAGISCAWALRHHDCDVDLYESNDRLGGHANSVPFDGNGRTVDVDTGFIAMDETTYPRFSAFLHDLGVQSIPTDMSFALSTHDGAFEWGSRSIGSFIGSWKYLFLPWFWRLLFDILRFTISASHVLSEETDNKHDPLGTRDDDSDFESIGDWLKRENYSDQFIQYFLIPMAAAPWCNDLDEFARSFPAKYLLQFMCNHGLLDVALKTLRWQSFRGGSKTYIAAFQKNLPARLRVHLNMHVSKVRREGGRATIEFADPSEAHQTYHHVVLAVHANQALEMLGKDATKLESDVLGSFKTSKNLCFLHSDTSLLPKRPSARMAWNCFLEKRTNETGIQKKGKRAGSPELRSKISMTFDMNKLQSIPLPGDPASPGHVLVSMNPKRIPFGVQSSHVYYHSVITADSIRMARDYLPKINGIDNVSFAGAWMGFGFHEDGFVAGEHAADIVIKGWKNTPPLDLFRSKTEGYSRGFTHQLLGLKWFANTVLDAVQWLLFSASL